MDAKILEAVDEPRTDPGGDGLAEETTVRVHTGRVVEDEGVLQGDDVPFHALHLGDMGDAAGAVAQSGDLDDEIDGGGDLLPDGAERQGHSRHQDQGFQTSDGGPWRV